MSQFKRDRFTWLAYFMLGYYAFLQAALGPLMPFLRSELDLSYTVSGLHFSAFALGMALAGLTGDRLAIRFGRRPLFWLGGLGMALGAVLLALSQTVYLSIGASFGMGLLGAWLLVMIQATLADHHGDLRAIPLTESNIVASVTATLAPLFVGGMEKIEAGWRSALWLGLAVWGSAFVFMRREPIPAEVKPETAQTDRLPLVFWLYCLLATCIGSVEWCVIFWGADFLETVAGLSKVNASAGMSAYFFANVVGRIAGSRLIRIYSSDTLLLAAIGVGMAGFPLFWLAESATLNLAGLFIAGLGFANLYPLTLSTATRAAVGQANTASARISMFVGLAILITPQVLASAADEIGIKNAYGIVAILLFVMLAIMLAANYTTRQQIRARAA